MQHEWDKVENYEDLEPEARAFVDWLIMPDELRKTKTQSQLAEELDVGENTLSKWKKRKPFNDIRQKRFKEVKAVEDLEDVLNAAKKRATAGEGKEANDATEIWLNWYYNQDFTKGTKVEQKQAQSSGQQTREIDLSEQIENDPEVRDAYRTIRKSQNNGQ